MAVQSRTVIVTGASQGIGAGLVRIFLEREYNVLATARSITTSKTFQDSTRLALVDGDISDPTTSDAIMASALDRFGRVDALVNNAGLFNSKPFLDYTLADYRRFSAVNIEGFLHITQRAVRQMLAQDAPGSVVTITTSKVVNPIVSSPASVPMITKGGLEAAIRSLALEFASRQIRFNAVAPGVVDTPMQAGRTDAFLKQSSPMGSLVGVGDIVDAVLYLTEASQVTGEVIHVDGGAHSGKW